MFLVKSGHRFKKKIACKSFILLYYHQILDSIFLSTYVLSKTEVHSFNQWGLQSIRAKKKYKTCANWKKTSWQKNWIKYWVIIRAVKNSALTTLISCLLLITSNFLMHFTHAQCDKLFRSGKSRRSLNSQDSKKQRRAPRRKHRRSLRFYPSYSQIHSCQAR